MSLNTMNNGQQLGQQQQQQQHNSNPETIRRNYRAALAGLTFNSKPIITNLTIMAQENQGAASIIVREIENQLRNNAPGQKLPVLYLIDSICKNVGGTYITNFARNMVTVFLDAYTLTDSTVRKSFERLLQTWKNGMPGGNPVFPRHIIESIERSIIYIREKSSNSRYPHLPSSANTSSSSNNNHSYQNNANNNIKAIHVNPNFVNKEPRINARDPRNKSPQVNAAKTAVSSSSLLSQLQTMLPATQTNHLSNNDPVSQIITQIKAILPTLPPAQAASIEQYLSQIASPSLSAATLSTTTTTTTSATSTPPLSSSTLSYPANNIIQHHQPTPPPLPPQQTLHSPVMSSIPSNITAKVDTADLLKSLTSMGYLSPSPPIMKPTQEISSNNETNTTTNPGKFGLFLLDSKDLQIVRPGAVELLYSDEPLQCKQCGFRYPKTEKGQAKMDAHLDSHFRQNRKMKERVKRGLSRSWFVTVDEWISGEGGELMSQQAPAFLHDSVSQASNKSTDKSNQVVTEEAIDPDSFTVVMPNPGMRKPCPVCGEKFIEIWNDDEEDWMFKNAVIVDGKIYHATCHADAVKSGSMAEKDTEMPDASTLDMKQDLKRKLDDQTGQIAKLPRMD